MSLCYLVLFSSESRFSLITTPLRASFFVSQTLNFLSFLHYKKKKTGLHLHTHIHDNIIYIVPKVEVTQMSIDRWIDRENVVIIYDVILHNLKKEGNLVIWYSVDDPWGHHDDKVSQSRKDRYVLLLILIWIHLREVYKIVRNHTNRKWNGGCQGQGYEYLIALEF